VERGQRLFQAERTIIAFTTNEAADSLLNDLTDHPHAFVLACVMDRQVKAERAWLIPYQLSQRLGGFSFDFLRSLPEERLHRAFTHPDPLHRFPETMSHNFYMAINQIEETYGGNAARIWMDEPPSARVVLRFLSFAGVGPKIATMATNILARDFKIHFSDYYSIDVSVDTHVRRVFTRLGLIRANATVEEVVYTARSLHPSFPGLMDFPSWEIGRSWCGPNEPQCSECYMHACCLTASELQQRG
jgi:endonuclease III